MEPLRTLFDRRLAALAASALAACYPAVDTRAKACRPFGTPCGAGLACDVESLRCLPAPPAGERDPCDGRKPGTLIVVPESAPVTAGRSLKLHAQVCQADDPIDWSVLGAGAIDAGGLYTAPPPQDLPAQRPLKVTVVATSRNDATRKATASLEVDLLALRRPRTFQGPDAVTDVFLSDLGNGPVPQAIVDGVGHVRTAGSGAWVGLSPIAGKPPVFVQPLTDTTWVGVIPSGPVQRSTDAGANWKGIPGLSSALASRLRAWSDGSVRRWLALYQGLIVRTDDEAATWSSFNPTAATLPLATWLAVSEQESGPVFAGGGGTVYRSLDGGKSFAARPAPPPKSSFGPQTTGYLSPAGELYLVSPAGDTTVYVSTDDGETFAALAKLPEHPALGTMAPYVLALPPGRLLAGAGVAPGGSIRVTAGALWAAPAGESGFSAGGLLDNLGNTRAVTGAWATADHLYLSIPGAGLHRGELSGRSAAPYGAGLPGPAISSIGVDGATGSVWVAVAGQGAAISRDQGVTFEIRGAPPKSWQVAWAQPTSGIVVAALARETDRLERHLYRSLDEGRTWAPLVEASGGTYRGSAPAPGGRVYALTSTSCTASDDATNFAGVARPGGSDDWLFPHPSQRDVVWTFRLGTPTCLQVNNSGCSPGASFSPCLDLDGPGSTASSQWVVVAMGESVIDAQEAWLASVHAQGVFYTTDGGANFTKSTIDAPGVFPVVFGFARRADTVVAVGATVGCASCSTPTGALLLVSFDAGKSFSRVSAGLAGIPRLNVAAVLGDDILVASARGLLRGTLPP